MSSQTTTVQKVIDFCSLHTSLQNYFGQAGISNEPGLTIANNVQQMLLVRPMSWKFNRKELSSLAGNFLVTQYGIQDFRFAGASAFVLQTGSSALSSGAAVDLSISPINGGSAGISVSGSTATVQTLDPHQFSVGQTVFLSGLSDSKFNSTLTFNVTTRASAWTGGFTILTVADQFHFTFAAPSATTATVTNIAITTNVVTVTAANSYKVGQQVLFAGVGTNTFLNGQVLTIASASSTQFTAAFQHADVTSGADTGTANICTGAPGITDWGWMESAVWQDINSLTFPQPKRPIKAVRNLAAASSPRGGDNLAICLLKDANNGVLTFRLSEPFGNYCGQINVIYQARAPKLTTPQSVFAWPDDLSFVLTELMLFQTYRYAKGISATETKLQMGIAQGSIASALAGEDREDNEQGLVPERTLM